MDALLWLTIVFLPALINAFDPSLSNGTCYFGANKKAANNYIPCGNAAGGVQTCCQARDVCLSSNACFNGQFYVTYLAGCTDENYDDPRCPDKGDFSSQPWVGLVRCKISDGAKEEWAGCAEPLQATVTKANEQCKCTASSSTALFTDAATLTNIASLPVSVGNAIAWFSGFEPSTTVSDFTSTSASSTRTSTSTSRPNTATPGTSVITSAAVTSTSLPDTSPPTTLSTAAKAGIGVGTAGGVLVIGAILVWLGWSRRRRGKAIPPIQDQIRPSSNGPWGYESGAFTDKTGSTAANHRSWGVKSELPTEANEITTTKTSLGENTIRTTFTTPATTYQSYQHSPTAEASELDASPTASTSRLAPGNSPYDKSRHHGPIYEMPG